MILVLGSEGAGKKEYVLSLGYAEEDFSCEPEASAKVAYHVEAKVFEDPDSIEDLYKVLLGKEVVICNEVGSGIIPAEYRLRRGREQTGRLCVLLAKEAEQVVRIVCGIPQRIK